MGIGPSELKKEEPETTDTKQDDKPEEKKEEKKDEVVQEAMIQPVQEPEASKNPTPVVTDAS
jgi:hypothetical protein